MPKMRNQKSNRRRYTGLPVAIDNPSRQHSHAARPIVNAGKTIWNETVEANWMRDRRRALISMTARFVPHSL